MVDDLDDTFRAAVRNGDIEKVFAKERPNLVSRSFHIVEIDTNIFTG